MKASAPSERDSARYKYLGVGASLPLGQSLLCVLVRIDPPSKKTIVSDVLEVFVMVKAGVSSMTNQVTSKLP